MRTSGAFTTAASAAQLRALFGSPTGLEAVPVLRDVTRRDPETLSMVFTPRISLGPIPMATTVRTVSDAAERVELAVNGQRGSQAVDVALVVELAAAQDGRPGTAVSWTADVVVRGVAASVGQRVGGDLATQAIGDLLASAADAATGGAA